jgi:hypothetical protein
MTRTAKLYERLELLEQEYRRLLGIELERLARRGQSWYLLGYSPNEPSSEELHLVRLAKEIRTLRGKLGEPLPGRYLELVNSIQEKAKELEFWLGGTRKSVAKELLVKLNNYV